jgi:hypothetical protein|tara:strand:- start:2039 stop:2260 length:222 start_codon:yes stop_codon:yes gene_type:complete
MTEEDITRHKANIDTLSHYEMIRLWRIAPTGHPYFRGDLPLFNYFNDRFRQFEISKQVGFRDRNLEVREEWQN